MRTLGAVTLLSLLLWGMVACSGSGGTTVAGGGTGGTGAVAYGTVTQLGSIWVNGVKWETEGAEIYLDSDQPVIGSSLPGGGDGLIEEGMVVAVEGILDAGGATGTAQRITYWNSVEGTVEAVNGNSFQVLQQTVLLEPGLTQVTDASGKRVTDLASLDLINQIVEVSGLVGTDGRIHARYIRLKTSAGNSAKGYITETDFNDPSHFWIGTLEVIHSSATVFAQGDFVHVQGTYVAPTLTANSVKRIGSSEVGEVSADQFEIEGIATDVVGMSMRLAGFPVNWTVSTEFAGGLPANIADGVRLEVEGRLIEGTLVADSIEFGDSIEIQGIASNVVGDSLTVEGLDMQISFGSATILPQALENGMKVSVRARVDGRGGLFASKVEAEPFSDTPRPLGLQAPLEGHAPGSFTILSQTYELSPNMAFYLSDDETTPVDEATFFASVNQKDLVEVEGDLDAVGAITWRSMARE